MGYELLVRDENRISFPFLLFNLLRFLFIHSFVRYCFFFLALGEPTTVFGSQSTVQGQHILSLNSMDGKPMKPEGYNIVYNTMNFFVITSP